MSLFMPFHYKKRRQMHTQIKRKLAPITRAKLHLLYSKSKEAIKVKHSLFDGWNGVHLSISGAKLGILIRSKNGQISFPIFVVEILISTCLFWFNSWHYLVIWFWAIKELCLLPNFEEDSAITTIRTCKKAVMYGAKVSMSLSSSFSILICTFLLFSVSSGPCVLVMNKDAI